MRFVDPERLVFIDEMGCGLNMGREYGRSPRGQRVFDKRPMKNSRASLTVLAMLTCIGLEDCMTVDSGTDYDVFESFVEHVLVPRLRPGDVVILDNLKAHSSPRAKEMIHNAQATLVFLPPYSPHLNPIELAFSKLKSIIRSRKPRSRKQIEDALADALILLTRDDALSWMAHCGYWTN